MNRYALTVLLTLALATPAAAAWRVEIVPTNGRVVAIDVDKTTSRIQVGQNWFAFAPDFTLTSADAIKRPAPPKGALPDGRVATDDGAIARAWLAAPTKRYDHGVLGDAIEAGALTIEKRDGRRGTITLDKDAVFEDLWPRIATLDGRDQIVVVKSYLSRGSALAIIDPDTMRIAAETPPIGHPHAWLNPAGIADFDGDGITDIALVRQPHVVGRLELWSFKDGKLIKTAEVADVANHVIGSRALGMSVVADIDGDGHPDLAVPSLDRKALRIIAFAPAIHDIARIALPARIATNIAGVLIDGRMAFIAGGDDGRLMVVRD